MKYKVNKRLVIIFVLLTLFVHGKLLFAQTTDNAALLYYQAFMLYEHPDNEDVWVKLNDVTRNGAEPDEQVEQYIAEQQYIINTIAKAADIKNCDWGIDYSVGIKLKLSHLSNIRPVAMLVIADAKILAKRDKYEKALQRCLKVHKMARHVAKGQLISLLVGRSLVEMANQCIQGILSEMPLDVTILEQLKSELAQINKEPFTLNNSLQLEYVQIAAELTSDRIQMLVDVIRTPITALASPNYTPKPLSESERKKREKQKEEQQKIEKIIDERLSNMDEAFIEGNKRYLKKLYLEDIPAAIELDYEQAYKKLVEIEQKTKEDLVTNPDTTVAAFINTPIKIVYNRVTANNNFTNALRAAVDIFLAKAKNGQLPDELLENLPKDLFSGNDFEYEKTSDGFILKCQGKDLSKDETYEYEFKVKK